MKLSLEALKERSEAVASTDLLATISGGIEEACHDVSFSDAMKMDAANSKNSIGSLIVEWIFSWF